MKARVLFYQKAKIHAHYIVELEILEIGDPVRYPDGIRYAMLCVDNLTKDRVLMDNHHPKGPHVHLNSIETPYAFSSVSTLMTDFKRLVLEHLGVKL